MKPLLFAVLALATFGCHRHYDLTRDEVVQLNNQGVDGGLAREIFVIEAEKLEGSGEIRATLVFWLLAPANRVRPNPGATAGIPPSTVVDPTNGVSWGYTAAELLAIRAGTTIVQTTTLTAGEVTGPPNLANFRAAADAKYAAAAAVLETSALGIKSIGMARTNGVWGAAP